MVLKTRLLTLCRRFSIKMQSIEPVTIKMDSEHFRSLFTPELIKLKEMFDRRNYELRIAGGAVRDLLMDIKPADVDFASTATPTQMKQIFEEDQIRMLHKRGEEHGTITCRIDDKENFEITTLRIDVLCDGRRAEVKYTTDWQLDANRRDLTINSLFLDLDGNVIDYFGGISDIEKRRVAFVGDAATRIQEDYLRILRYFRFFGRISDTSTHEEATIRAIIDNSDGMRGISAERIWTELKKIVIGRMAPDVMDTMIEKCRMQKYLGLPEECNLARFRGVFNKFQGSLEPMTMIASLCEHSEEIANFHRITKLSNDERFLGEFVINERHEAEKNRENQKYWFDRIVDLEIKPSGDKSSKEVIRRRVVQLAKSVLASDTMIAEIEQHTPPEYPINGRHLHEYGVKPPGPHIQNVLMYLFEIWKKSNYTMSRDELLKHAEDDNIPIAPRNRGKKSRSPGK